MPSPTTPDTRLARYVDQAERSVRALADRVRDADGAWCARTADLPWVWTLNQVCCTAPMALDALVALCDEWQADLPFRHLVVRDPATSRAAEAELAASGSRVERDVVMALDGRPERPSTSAASDGARVGVELTEDQMLALMEEWLLEEHVGVSEEGLAQVLEYNRREGRLWGERRLGVLGPDGTPLAATKLRVDGSFGWVEDVFTTPAARGRGYARALVTTAADAAVDAGCTLVAIVADDDDWPKQLYASIGFAPVGAARIFHLEAPASD